jgi:hypothetical protein
VLGGGAAVAERSEGLQLLACGLELVDDLVLARAGAVQVSLEVRAHLGHFGLVVAREKRLFVTLQALQRGVLIEGVRLECVRLREALLGVLHVCVCGRRFRCLAATTSR